MNAPNAHGLYYKGSIFDTSSSQTVDVFHSTWMKEKWIIFWVYDLRICAFFRVTVYSAGWSNMMKYTLPCRECTAMVSCQASNSPQNPQNCCHKSEWPVYWAKSHTASHTNDGCCLGNKPISQEISIARSPYRRPFDEFSPNLIRTVFHTTDTSLRELQYVINLT